MKYLAVILVSLIGANGILGADRYDDLEECPRFAPEELKRTLFQRITGEEMHLLRETLYKGVDGVIELLDGIGERNNPMSKVDSKRVRQVVDMIKPETHKVFMQIFRDFEEAWQNILEPSEETGLRKTIIESRQPFQRVHTVIHTMHNRVTDLYEGLAFAAKTIIDPIIEMLTMFIKQSPDPTVKNNELLEKLQEKSKLWGLVVAQLVNEKLGNIEIPEPDFGFRSNDYWSHFTVMLYKDGLPNCNEGEDPALFWQRSLEELWAFDWDDKYCRKEDLGEPGDECDLNFMVSLLAQAVAHTSEEDDPEFWNKTEDEYQVRV